MNYAMFSLGTGEPADALEAHVLARAYRAAWCALYLSDPTGRHTFPRLDLAIDFGRTDSLPLRESAASPHKGRA